MAKTEKTKTMISIRLDPDTLAAYRSLGPGWQTRMARDLDRLAKRIVKEQR